MKSTAAPRPLPFLSNPAFSPTPPFLEKFFYPCLNFQIRASQPPPPLWKWGGGEGGGVEIRSGTPYIPSEITQTLMILKLIQNIFRKVHLV